MKKILIIISLFLTFLNLATTKINAKYSDCLSVGGSVIVDPGRAGVTNKFTVTVPDPNRQYGIELDCENPQLNDTVDTQSPVSGKIVFEMTASRCSITAGTHKITLKHQDGGVACQTTYLISPVPAGTCTFTYTPSIIYTDTDPITVEIVYSGNLNNFTNPYLDLTGPSNRHRTIRGLQISGKTFTGTITGVTLSAGPHTVDLVPAPGEGTVCPTPPKTFEVYPAGTTPLPSGAPASGCDQCGWCEGKDKPDYWNKCNACIIGETLKKGGTLKPGAWTALGCISTDPSGFVAWLLQKVIGIAGGIAFLLILFGGFQILTSAGNPEKLASGKDIVVSAIAGLLMIIFSVLLLRVIGYDILRIPGF